MDVSIVIVNYNTTKYLRNCLESIFKYTSKLCFEIIIVDNNSPERDIEYISNEYPNIKILYRNINEGFGTGCNYGSTYASGKYLLFVNPDVFFLSSVLFELFTFMEENLNAAIISPIYIENDNECFLTTNNFPDYDWQINAAFGNSLNMLRSRLRSFEKQQINEPIEVNWVTGSFMLVRTDIFKSVNGFDGNMFLYYEDIDLQLRIKSLGHKIIYHPRYKIKHFKRSSVRSYNGENLYYYHMSRSNLIYMFKHYNFFQRNIVRILNLFSIILKIIFLPFRKKYTGKKKQKLFQYVFLSKLFLSSKKHIYENKFFMPVSIQDSDQITNNDIFWQ